MYVQVEKQVIWRSLAPFYAGEILQPKTNSALFILIQTENI